MAMNALAFERIWFEKSVHDTAEKNYYQQLVVATSNQYVKIHEHKDERVVFEHPHIMATNYLAFEHIWFKKSEYDNAEKNYYQQLTVDQSNRLVKLRNDNARPCIKYNANCIEYIRKYITRSEEIVMKPSDTEEAATDRAETKEVESQKIKTEETETEEAATDKAETKQVETEKIKSEKTKTEEAATDIADTKEAETEKIKNKKIKAKKIKTEKTKTEVASTAYKGKKRSYGEYCCIKCSRSWKSVNSWSNQGQRCKTCNVVTYPHRQLALEKVGLKAYVFEKTDNKHLQNLCAECKRTNRPIHKLVKKFNGYKTVWTCAI